MIRRTIKHRRSKTRPVPGNVPQGTPVVVVMTLVGGQIQCDFSMPVSVSGTPAVTSQGVLPTGCTVNSATRITLAYADAVIATNVGVYPPNDPAVRSANGGFVVPATTTF